MKKLYILPFLFSALQASFIELNLTPEEEKSLLSIQNEKKAEKILQLKELYAVNDEFLEKYIDADINKAYGEPLTEENTRILENLSPEDFEQLTIEHECIAMELEKLEKETGFLEEEITIINKDLKKVVHNIDLILSKLKNIEDQRWPKDHDEVAFNKLSQKLATFKRRLESIAALIKQEIIPTTLTNNEGDFEIIELD